VRLAGGTTSREDVVRGASILAALTLSASVGVGPARAWQTYLGSHGSGALAELGPDGDVFFAGSQYSPEGEGFLAARLSGADGSILWRVALDGDPTAPDYDSANALALDPAGNPIVAGSFQTTAGGADFAVVKLDAATGGEIWRRTIDGPVSGPDFAREVGVDPAGDVIAAGQVFGAFPTLASWLIVKLDGTSGAVVWSRTIDGGDPIDTLGLAIDPMGNVAVAGFMTNPTTDTDFTVVKLSGSTGADLWPPYVVPNITSLGFETAWDVTTDAAGDVYATGAIGGDGHVVRLAAADGSVVWSHTIEGGSSGQTARAIVLAPDGDAVVATDGLSQFVTRLAAADGSVVWEGGFPNGDAWSLALDADGDVIVGGSLREFLSYDFALAKLDAASGALRWQQVIVGFDTSSSFSGDLVTALVVDADDRVIAAGRVTRRGAPDSLVVVSVSSRLPGDLQVRDDALDPNRRKIVLRSTSPDLLVPGAGGLGDPTLGGASLMVSNPGTLETFTTALPAANWTAKPTSDGVAVYRYRDSSFAAGPCRAVTLRTGRKLVAKCIGAQIGFTLDEPSQSVLDARLVLGTNGFPFCFTFGPGAASDTSTAGGSTGLFRVKAAPPAAICAGE
jgi:outer membrane protein assembly factor BamB